MTAAEVIARALEGRATVRLGPPGHMAMRTAGEVLAALRAAPAETRLALAREIAPDQWRGGGTAPTDGTPFLGALSNDWVIRMWAGPSIAVRARPRYAWWSTDGGVSVPFEPSHHNTEWLATTLRLKAWQPLPAPPVAAAEPREGGE